MVRIGKDLKRIYTLVRLEIIWYLSIFKNE